MLIPKSREELIEAIEINLERLARDLGTLNAQEINEVVLEGHAKGTTISVHNLVSYLLGWNNLVLKWIEKDAKGELVDFPESASNGTSSERLRRISMSTSIPYILVNC